MVSMLVGFLSIVVFGIVYYYDFSILHRIKDADFASFSAGVGSVYVFIHMLPQLSHGQHLLEDTFPTVHFTGSQYTIYLVALAGFLFFYMFDTFLTHTRRLPTDEYSTSGELAFYWTNVIFISLYNMLIGYVVGSYTTDSVSYRIIYMVAYVVHFLAIKHGIYHVFPKKYKHQGRYPIILGLFVGYFIGYFFPVSELVLSISESLLTGAMVLSVFKHELPNEQDSKMKAFTIGIISSILLFMLL